MIKLESEQMERFFGSDGVLTLLRELQEQCDIHAKQIISLFKKHHSIKTIMSRVAQPKPGELDTSPIGGVLEQMAMMGYTMELFQKFIAKKCKQLGPTSEAKLSYKGLEQRKKRMLVYYNRLEDIFIRDSISKAIRLDERSELQLTSTVVDDCFYLLQRSAHVSLAIAHSYC